MALNTEIDALLAEADAQGLTVEQVLQQVFLRKQSELNADDPPLILFEDHFPSTPTEEELWDYLHEYLSDYDVTTPTDVVYSRLWSAFVSKHQRQFLNMAYQLVRCIARDFRYNSAYPSYAMKTKTLTGTATLVFS